MLFRYLVMGVIMYGAEIWGRRKRTRNNTKEVCKVVPWPRFLYAELYSI